MMLEAALIIAAVVLALSLAAALYRVLRGPSAPDRIVALDVIGVHLAALIAVVSVMLESESFADITLLIAVIAFLGTVAFSKFIEKGEALEYDRNRKDGG